MSDTNLPVLELRGVSKSFTTPDGKTFQAIKDVNLVIPDVPDAGEFRVFLGPSGCGKSTILNIVAGLYRQTAGLALLRGKPINGPGPDRGMVFQSYSRTRG
jgi:NitT/TauT family transport system ATP-binding protein